MTVLDRFRRSRGLSVLLLVVFLSTFVPRTASADNATVPADTPGPPALSVPESGANTAANDLATVSVEPSTGAAHAQVPIRTPHARGLAQPTLSLSYASTRGVGFAGWGWTLDVPAIERAGLFGGPNYDDPAQPLHDRVYFNGRSLVPLCTIPDNNCKTNPDSRIAGYAPTGEQFPSFVTTGWSYFRPEVEGDFQRFFLSADRQTWVVQSKSGLVMEFGVPLDGSHDTSALDSDTGAKGVYRWNLARAYDAHVLSTGAPSNPVIYRWAKLPSPSGSMSAQGYLTDVFDTPPPAGGSDTSQYAHHVHLAYELPASSFTLNAAPLWRATPYQRLVGIDVTSRGSQASREQVRRYHLTYQEQLQRSYLQTVTLEGFCDTTPNPAEKNGLLPAGTSCPAWPTTTFGYSQPALVPNPAAKAVVMSGKVPVSTVSPGVFLDSTTYDVNADGITDFVGYGTVAMSGLNSLTAFSSISITPPSGQTYPLPSLDVTPGVVPHSVPPIIRGNFLDDGRLNAAQTGHVFEVQPQQPGSATGAFQWVDFPNANLNVPWPFAVADLDGDGLTDMIGAPYPQGPKTPTAFFSVRDGAGHSTPLYVQAGLCGGGDATGNSLLNPPSGVVSLMADMNADGLPDIVWVRTGTVTVFPGHGDGTFGECTNGTPYCTCAASAGVNASLSPSIASDDIDPSCIQAHDVTGDGIPEIVVVHQDSYWVYSGAVGATSSGFAGVQYPETQFGFPAGSHMKDVMMTFADMDASGADDLVLRDPTATVAYVPFTSDEPPGLLESMNNGLGGTTSIAYVSTTSLSLPVNWSMPQPMHVVSSLTRSQSNPWLESNTTTYAYDRPAYDGRTRTFLGFGSVTTTRVGDTNEPTSVTHTTFAFAPCEQNAGWLSGNPCPRQSDRPELVQRGLPVLIEESDAAGAIYRFSTHTQFHVTELYTGVDDRVVRYAWPPQRE